MKKYIPVWLLLCLLGFFASAGNLDSLMQSIEDSPDDSIKVEALLQASKKCYGSQFEKGVELANQAKALSEKIGYPTGIRNSLNKIAYHHLRSGKYEKALEYFFECIKEDEKHNREVMIGHDYLNIGNVYFYLGVGDQVIQYWNKAAIIYEKLDRKEDLSLVFGNMLGYLESQGKLDSAMVYGKKALKIAIARDNKSEIASIYNNLGNIYVKRVKLNKAKNDESNREKYLNEAIVYYDKALKLYELLKEQRLIGLVSSNLGVTYDKLGQYAKGRKLQYKALDIYREVGDKEGKMMAFSTLADNLKSSGNYVTALDYKDSVANLNAALRSEASDKAIAEMQTKYETEKKEKENALLKKDNELKEATLQQKEMIERFMAGGILSLFIIVGLIFYQFRQKKKANKLLNEQNEEILSQNEEITSQRDYIESQNQELAQKNDHIMSSIQYAKRIQEAILPSDELVNSNFAESFVLYKPKDIVSGDFYWMEVIDERVYWAAVDCTGHGVPGAFMSILGANGLKKIVLERGIQKPSEILDHLTNHVINSIKATREGEEVKDGMDIALCCWDKSTNMLEYAGAYNPLYLLREKGKPMPETLDKPKMSETDTHFVVEVKATKRPVGRFKRRNIPDFKNNVIKLEKNDIVYVFSDGYADQFGGSDGMKFTYRRMRELILRNCGRSMNDQRDLLDQEFELWRGTEEQLDDICIFGVKFR